MNVEKIVCAIFWAIAAIFIAFTANYYSQLQKARATIAEQQQIINNFPHLCNEAWETYGC